MAITNILVRYKDRSIHRDCLTAWWGLLPWVPFMVTADKENRAVWAILLAFVVRRTFRCIFGARLVFLFVFSRWLEPQGFGQTASLNSALRRLSNEPYLTWIEPIFCWCKTLKRGPGPFITPARGLIESQPFSTSAPKSNSEMWTSLCFKYANEL